MGFASRFLPVEPRSFTFRRVFLFALAVRVLFIAMLVTAFPEWWRSTSEKQFPGWEMGFIAVNVAEGRGFSSPFSMGSEPTAWLCPLVPYLWAGVLRAAGGARAVTYDLLVLLQACANAMSVAFYWLIARDVTRRDERLSARAAPLAALVLSVWPDSLLRLPDLWYYFWQELGLAAVIWLAMRWCDEPSRVRGVALGAVAGVVILVNVTPLPIYAGALALPFLQARNRRVEVGYAAAMAALATVLIATPWLVRNAVVFGEFVPLRSNAALELWQGNNPNGAIRQRIDSVHPFDYGDEFALYHSMGEIGYMRYCRQRSVDYMASHVRQTVVRAVERIYVAWCTDIFDQWSWSDDQKWWRGDAGERFGRVTTILSALLPLGITVFGAWSGRLRHLPHGFLFASVLFFMPLPHYLTQIQDAYTHVVRCWLALLAIIVVNRRSSGVATVRTC